MLPATGMPTTVSSAILKSGGNDLVQTFFERSFAINRLRQGPLAGHIDLLAARLATHGYSRVHSRIQLRLVDGGEEASAESSGGEHGLAHFYGHPLQCASTADGGAIDRDVPSGVLKPTSGEGIC